MQSAPQPSAASFVSPVDAWQIPTLGLRCVFGADTWGARVTTALPWAGGGVTRWGCTLWFGASQTLLARFDLIVSLVFDPNDWLHTRRSRTARQFDLILLFQQPWHILFENKSAKAAAYAVLNCAPADPNWQEEGPPSLTFVTTTKH